MGSDCNAYAQANNLRIQAGRLTDRQEQILSKAETQIQDQEGEGKF